MLQAVMTSPGTIEYREVPEPEPGPGQIKVRIKRIGICGSDVHVYHGKHPYTRYPVVQGHEVSAKVVGLGTGVAEFRVGDPVTIQPQIVCGTCYPCTHGMYNDCEVLKVMGFQATGMAGEYFVVDAPKALRLPPQMTWDQGALIEPLAVAVHAVNRYGDVMDKCVAVLGAGPIGNLVAQVARAKGAAAVLVTEPSPYRRKLASECGITAEDPGARPLRDSIRERFGSDGADVILECVGADETMEQAIGAARKGSDIIVVGVFSSYGSINMGFVQDHELRLTGTAMYREEDYREAIAMAGDGRVQLDLLISHHVPFRDYGAGYRIIEEQRDRAMKVLVNMD